ncbi:MAG: Lrp/AsnC family transcriptional regulator, partial [Clostridia bacterium]|nr:Lrp/AsnC family transcriptional regulator [Clostridia bacterium]
MEKILSLLEENAMLTPAQLAAMLGLDEEQVRQAIDEYEKSGIIRGYTA